MSTPEALAAQLESFLFDASVAKWDAFIASIPPQPSSFANEMWFVRQVAEARRSYLCALQEMYCGSFYEAWCRLEQIELALRDLLTNQVYDVDRFAVRELARIVQRWQSIFPYRMFASPEIVIKAEDCSICGARVDPWSDCGHEIRKLYDGRICHRIVRDMEFLSVSIVERPVQKSAVLDPYSPNYDYAPLKFVLARLPNAFFEWRVEHTTALYPMTDAGLLEDDEYCPCGSRQSHGTCCKGKPSIVLPHLEFWFGEFGEGARHEVEMVISQKS